MFSNTDPSGPASTTVVATTAVAAYKAQVETLTNSREAIMAEIEHYKGIIEEIQGKYDEETASTKGLEVEWTTLKQEVDSLYLTMFDLQTKISGVEDQIILSKQIYEAKMKEVQNIVTGGMKAAVSISVDNSAQVVDVTTAIGDVKAQYETLAARSKEDAFAIVQNRISHASTSSQPTIHALTASKEEFRDLKLQLDSLRREIDRVRGLNLQLENQISETETSNGSQSDQYQEQINTLRSQLDDIRKQIAQYGQEYQELLASKMSLDIEITAYKKLLDSEESRLSSGSGIIIQMSKSMMGGGGSGAGIGAGGGAGGAFAFGAGAGAGAGIGGGTSLGFGLGSGLSLGGLSGSLSLGGLGGGLGSSSSLGSGVGGSFLYGDRLSTSLNSSSLSVSTAI